MKARTALWILALAAGGMTTAPGLAQRPAAGGKPEPDHSNVRYGPHERNVLDFWKAKGDKPAPLVVFIHGGGFRAGDKAGIPAPLLNESLRAGFAVASINYRLSHQAPFPAPMLDGARAIQFLRNKAEEWKIDPERIAASGGSAGAGISLWVGYHDDLKDPKSDDPVERRSSRLTCMGVFGAQSSYDPRFIKKFIGGRAHEHPALMPFYGLKEGEEDTPKAHKLYEQAAPINHVSADDPPCFLFYSEPKGPLPKEARPGQGIHHINFGLELKKKLDPLKIECVIKHSDDYKGDRGGQQAMFRDVVEFFGKQFGTKGKSPKPEPAGDRGEKEK